MQEWIPDIFEKVRHVHGDGSEQKCQCKMYNFTANFVVVSLNCEDFHVPHLWYVRVWMLIYGLYVYASVVQEEGLKHVYRY